MTTVEAPPVAEDSTPRSRGGRPRLNSATGPSPQAPIIFGVDQEERGKVLATRLHVSRNKLVRRAAAELLAQHGRKSKPPIDVPESAGRRQQKQWIPESGDQLAALGALAERWDVTRDAVLRVAFELLLLQEGIAPLPKPEPAPEPTTPPAEES